MNALVVLLLALAFLAGAGCAPIGRALEETVPAIDTAATAADQAGGCLRLVCAAALWQAPPLSQCRIRPARCARD